MASSGTITSAKFGGGFYIDIKWATQSQSTSSNSSSVKVDVIFRATSGYSTSTTATKNGSVTINGTVHNFTFTAGLSSGGSKTVKSVTQTIGHNSDGNKSVALSTTLGINLTLSGSYVGNASASGTAVLDKINLTTAPGVGRMSSPSSGTISEKATSISVGWTGFTNGTNNTVNKYEIQYSKNNGAWTGLATVNTTATSGSYTHTITAAEGQTYKYRVRGCGSSGTWTGYTGESGTVTTNTFTAGWFTGHSTDVGYGTPSFTLYFTGGKNSDNTGIRYQCYSDNVTIYNQTETTDLYQIITIWRSGAYPSSPYIKFDDLKNLYKNSNYNGRLHVGLRTSNGRGYKYAGGSIGVDLRVNPVAPSSVTISQTVSSTTAYRKHTGLNDNFYVPDGSKTISFSWAAGSSPLGSSYFYRLYVIRNGSATVLADNIPSTTTSYTYTPPKVSSGTQTLAFGVHTVTSYGYSSHRDSGNVTLHSYSPPTISTSVTERTATGAKVAYRVTTNSSLSTAATGSWSCSGATPPSGTISSTAQQTITFTGLAASSSYTVNFTYNDNSGWSGNQSRAQAISQQLSVMEVTKDGLGIGGVAADTTNKLKVQGRTLLYTDTSSTTWTDSQLEVKSSSSGIPRILLHSPGLAYSSIAISSADTLEFKTERSGVIKVQNTSGYATMGAQNASHFHFRTDRPGFWFDKEVRVQGEIYAGSGYNQRVWHAGNFAPANYVSGSNGAAVNPVSDANKIWKSGFYEMNGGSNNPAGNNWLWLINAGHSSNNSGGNYQYGMQIAAQNITNSNFYIRTTNQGGAGTWHRIWTSGSFNPDTKFHSGGTYGTVYLTDWFRAKGQTGFYCQDYGGGIYMTDSSWLRSYGSKPIYNGGVIRSDGGFQTTSDWAIRRVATGGIYFGWNDSTATKYRAYFTSSGASGTAGSSLTADQPTLKLENGGGGLHLFPAKDAAGGVCINRASWSSYGDVTCAKLYQTSDRRLKENIETIGDSDVQMASFSRRRDVALPEILGIISKANLYKYSYLQDRHIDTEERPHSFGLMTDELPDNLVKKTDIEIYDEEEEYEEYFDSGSNETRKRPIDKKNYRRMPKEVKKGEGDHFIDVYGVAAVAWGGVRELTLEVYKDRDEIEYLKEENFELRRSNSDLINRLSAIEKVLISAGLAKEQEVTFEEIKELE